MRIALVYDRVNKWGGAERILLALNQLFPKAPLFTSVYNSKKASWADNFHIKTSFLQNFPKASLSHERYALLMPAAFESFDFDEYDLVISVTSEAAKGIITKPKTLHICYCLTPTRYLWSGYKDYFNNFLFRLISYPAVQYLRKWDKTASQRPDAYISISKEVQKRIKEYYKRDSFLVYPAIDFEKNLNDSKENTANKPENFFLVVSRLVSYKKIDIAIKAFNKLKLPLKIVGTGSAEKKLRSIAKRNIEFLGDLTDEQLLRYYKGCKALVFTSNEDLGLTVLEANSFGKPVIAFKDGGALETVIEGKTGKFFYPQEAEALIKAIEVVLNTRFDAKICIIQAEKFCKNKFVKEFTKTVDNLIKEHNKK